MRVLMVGVDKQTKGGMWSVVANYIDSYEFVKKTDLKYIPTSITGSAVRRVLFTGKALTIILRELLTKKYDIVHVHMAERGSVYRKNIVISMAKLFQCKIVIHMHGAEFEQWYQSLKDLRKKKVRKILNKADKVLILGKYWDMFVRSLMHDDKKVSVVYNAVTVPKENRYNSISKNMLFLGAVVQRKGVYDLLRAVKQLDSKMPTDVKLLIYGPDFENKIERVIVEHNLSSRVEYRGWLTAEDKEKVFADTAVNILPSYNEGLPMTILECMAHGIPNISTNVAAIPEAVNSQNGKLIEPGDINQLAQAIETMVEDQVLREAKSDAAYADAQKHFSVDAHFKKVIDIYRELVERSA